VCNFVTYFDFLEGKLKEMMMQIKLFVKCVNKNIIFLSKKFAGNKNSVKFAKH